jgi:YidC/Oxa1 family membrane protein insertase
MAALYKKEKVNPLGGCLPLLLQMPIFIALYGVLSKHFALRGAPFMLWINDLSQPDALFMLPEWVPHFGGGPFNLLPVLMIAAMFIQQRLSSKSGDPQQEQTQKMMMWMMPLMFGFFFYGMPSGLVLYFMTSTAIGAAETKWIRSHLDQAAAAPARDPKKQKETWVERAARAKAARSRRMK